MLLVLTGTIVQGHSRGGLHRTQQDILRDRSAVEHAPCSTPSEQHFVQHVGLPLLLVVLVLSSASRNVG